MVIRDKCILSQNEDLEHIHTFKNFPIFCGCVETDFEKDMFFDMIWKYSKSSGIVQLGELVPLDLLYRNHHNSGTVGKTWEDHHRNFANFIKKQKFESVLEIGGATGSLFKHFKYLDHKFIWNVLEPSGVFNESDPKIKVISDYLESYDFNDQKFDTIVHSHVIEHIYDPIPFLNKIHNLLDDGGHQFISFPNIPEWIRKGYANALFFEHTYYLDENIIENLLNKTGFEILDIVKNDHSIFVSSIKSEKKDRKFYHQESLIDFNHYLTNLRNTIQDISNFVGGDKVYLFGAHIFGQIILNGGLDKNNVIYILDNDKNKWDKRLYGTNLIVKSPEILSGIKNPKVIVNVGIYTEEIKMQIKDTINNSVVFYKCIS
jgi:2-polyprenyl-3-methyl-5-hydroxy-6-metoxy-1,4-benzoquinol methylase